MPNILMLAPTAKSFLSRNMHENPTFRSPKSLTCQYRIEGKLTFELQALPEGELEETLESLDELYGGQARAELKALT